MPLLASFGCRSVVDGEVGFPPFVGFGPHLEGNTPEPSTNWVVRPLIGAQDDGARSDTFALWPLYRRQRDERTDRHWLAPLWSHTTFHAEGRGGDRVDFDGFVLPFWFYGSDTQTGDYFGFFPLGGVLKGILGQDRSSWILFPLYLHLQDRDRSSTHVLFPIFNRVTAPHRSGWRVFPFYAHYRAETPEGVPKYDRRTYLWPFVHFHDNDLDTDRPVQARWFWPFYGSIDAPSFHEWSVLWPLVTYRSSKLTPGWKLTVFPLFVGARAEDLRQTDFYPLFGIKTTPTSYRHFALFPIHRFEHLESESRTLETTWILPFYWSQSTRDHETGARTRSLHVWPLLRHLRDEDGTRHTALLDFFPFADDGPFERLYARLWQVFRSVDRGPAGSAWELLWGVVQREVAPEGSRFSVLGGIFEVARDQAGTRHWRLLYVPF